MFWWFTDLHRDTSGRFPTIAPGVVQPLTDLAPQPSPGFAATRLREALDSRLSKAIVHLSLFVDMATKPRSKLSGPGFLDDPRFFMLDGITAEENEHLQERARAAVTQLFHRRVKRPAKLVSDLHSALRLEGFVHVQVKLVCQAIALRATMSKKLQTRLRPRKDFPKRDLVSGVVTVAARRSGLDPRMEDIAIQLVGDRVKAYVNPVPFIFEERLLDNVVAKWRKSKRRSGKRAPR